MDRDSPTDYKILLEALEARYQSELKLKDDAIAFYQQLCVEQMEIIKKFAERPVNIKINTVSESKSMSESSKYDQRHAQFAGGFAETVQGDQMGGDIHNYASQQNLTEAAREIQELLTQLEYTYPTTTLVEKAVVVEEALKRIDENPTLKQRIAGTLKEAGVEALTQAIDHPLVNILRAAFEGWHQGS